MAIEYHPLCARRFFWRWLVLSWNGASAIYGPLRAWKDAITAVFAISAAIALAHGVKTKQTNASAWWLLAFPFCGFVASFAWHLVKSPHDIYNELERKRRDDIEMLGKDKTAIIEKLLHTTDLQDTERDKAEKKRRLVKHVSALGGKRVELMCQTDDSFIKSLNAKGYDQDKDSVDLYHAAYDTVKELFGNDEAALFANANEMNKADGMSMRDKMITSVSFYEGKVLKLIEKKF